ncbi:MAG TPA: carboxypeptidase-like regulatory domain-containing protein [Blastocatellia bacterium]|nr:carboxypeptidase-like regulatory domain-containing protein [Blastocatellia bacterium]
MSRLTGINAWIAVVFIAASAEWGQSQSPDSRAAREATGAITGRVTIGGKPVAGLTVALLGPETNPPPSPLSKTSTDDEGAYRLTRLPAGQYRVVPFGPALVIQDEANPAQPGRRVSVADGETVDKIDFALKRGGVITGRVTDTDGRPLTGQRVTLIRIDARGQKPVDWLINPPMYVIDDRGIYRIFGLPAGRYIVSAGEAASAGLTRIGNAAGYHPLTFHPSVTDATKATVIELEEGQEATGTDIVVGAVMQTFEASGRIIDAESGRPVPNILYGWAAAGPDGKTNQGYTYGYQANSRGEFHIGGLVPGHYAAFVVYDRASDLYSEPAVFEVINADVKKLEVKLQRGGVVTGVAEIENTGDPAAWQKLREMEITSSIVYPGFPVPRFSSSRVSADGSFKFVGVHPGTIRLALSRRVPLKGFRLLRVEHNGADQTDGFAVGPREEVTGVRAVLSYGTAVIRGQVRVEGGTLAAGARLQVSVRLADSQSPRPIATVEVDGRGRFTIDSLAPGQYELTLATASSGAPAVTERALAVNDAETEVALVLNLKPKEKEGPQ